MSKDCPRCGNPMSSTQSGGWIYYACNVCGYTERSKTHRNPIVKDSRWK